MNSSSTIDLSEETSLLHLGILTAVWMILILTIVFGTTGNLLVLYVYVNRNDKKTCSFFIKTLAVVDLSICLVLAPLELYQTTIGIHQEYLCKFYGFLTTHVLYSTFLITAIAFDRYFCICWPLYKIITIARARIIVVVCGFLSSLFALIPMSEYSTFEHILQLHGNHSGQFSLESFDDPDGKNSPVYTHIENLQIDQLNLPFILGNLTEVKCSPKFSLQLQFSNYVLAYRLFHSLLFVACLLLVLFFYGCIYKAIYQRRLTRTRKLSTYQKVLRSYLIDSDHLGRSSPSRWICSRLRRTKRSEHRTDIEEEEQNESNQRLTRANPPEQIVLEMHRARGKRYSAVSMTSMTYLTSGVWDDTTSSANLLRSRISSVTATTFCGTEQRSTSTEESFEQTTHKPLQNKASTTSHSTHLTVPGQCQATISLVNDPSSVRSTPRISDGSIQQRKVSFMLSTLISERSVVEDCPLFEQRIAEGGDERRNASISSTRRLSTFDAETERIFERQQRQERLANIRTTLTLFIVTATFILMYLPSIVIILFDIKPHEFREIFFLLYYINSAFNPLIYSFFNVNFRNDIRRIYECQKREYMARIS